MGWNEVGWIAAPKLELKQLHQQFYPTLSSAAQRSRCQLSFAASFSHFNHYSMQIQVQLTLWVALRSETTDSAQIYHPLIFRCLFQKQLSFFDGSRQRVSSSLLLEPKNEWRMRRTLVSALLLLFCFYNQTQLDIFELSSSCWNDCRTSFQTKWDYNWESNVIVLLAATVTQLPLLFQHNNKLLIRLRSVLEAKRGERERKHRKNKRKKERRNFSLPETSGNSSQAESWFVRVKKRN